MRHTQCTIFFANYSLPELEVPAYLEAVEKSVQTVETQLPLYKVESPVFPSTCLPVDIFCIMNF